MFLLLCILRFLAGKNSLPAHSSVRFLGYVGEFRGVDNRYFCQFVPASETGRHGGGGAGHCSPGHFPETVQGGGLILQPDFHHLDDRLRTGRAIRLFWLER
jgi:hypothetical protein